MSVKPAPEWGIWLHMDRLSAEEAVALTFGVEPAVIQRDSRGTSYPSGHGMATLIQGFESRERLYLRNQHQRNLTPKELALWALALGWNIPVELASLHLDWRPPNRKRSATAAVDAALAGCVAPGVAPSELRNAVEQLGGQFVREGGDDVLVLPDGTVQGHLVPLSQGLWSELCGRGVDQLLRGSGASGGAAAGGKMGARFPLLSGAGVNQVPPGKPETVSAFLTHARVGPAPVGTSEIAFCFAGLRGWDEQAWKKNLGSPRKWLEACIVVRGRRGGTETQWDPVRIGAALVHDGSAASKSVRSRFQARDQLRPWLDAWKTYEADNFDN